MKQAFPIRLDSSSGVPVYRQIIDQVLAGIAAGQLHPGDQLPTMRQLAVDLSVNLNTVLRSYRELELRGIIETQQGTGTFISKQKKPNTSEAARRQRLEQLAGDCVSRAGREGFTVQELVEELKEYYTDAKRGRS